MWINVFLCVSSLQITSNRNESDHWWNKKNHIFLYTVYTVPQTSIFYVWHIFFPNTLHEKSGNPLIREKLYSLIIIHIVPKKLPPNFFRKCLHILNSWQYYKISQLSFRPSWLYEGICILSNGGHHSHQWYQ